MKSQKRRWTSITALVLFTLVVAGAVLVFPFAMQADNDDFTTFVVDVAQDGRLQDRQISKIYRQNNVDPAAGQTVFTRGDTFIVNGTIYPGNTLPKGSATNDPNAPGGIGKYQMTGTFATDAVNFLLAIGKKDGADPVLALGSEVFSFGQEAQKERLLDGGTILTDGLWPNAHFSALRVVLGGTGRHRAVVGETLTENIGENITGFCNLRVTFRIKRVPGDRQ